MSKVIGFDDEFNSLFKNLENNTLSNSTILSGNKGIGKRFFIMHVIEEFIKIKSNKDQFNHHLNLLNNNSHPNVKILEREQDEKTKKFKNFITIDQIRKLNQFSRETSLLENLNKFIVIDSADNLNINASNALLKILEEPKSNTFFFLISHQPALLLPTIRSRCLKINFKSHDFSNFKKITLSQEILDDEIIKFLFDITNGSPGLAYEYDFNEILEIFDRLINAIIDSNIFSVENNFLVERFSSFDSEKLKIYISIIKFILITLNKIKFGININDFFLSTKIKKIQSISNDISLDYINKKLEYLIKYENDLFTFNLDKKVFMINFFAER
mgnify:CR=1 FL=1